MDKLASLRTCVRVADLGSFTRAADSLALSRAVVSTQVADLERHLGTKLFHRTTRRVGLTADGADFIERCRRILAELDAAEERLRGGRSRPQGRLRIDVPTSVRYLLVPALPQFTERYPELQLEIQFNDRVIDLVEEQVDLTVRLGAVSAPNLVARSVCPTRVLTCAAPEYLRQHGVPLEPEELRRHRLIGSLPGGNRRPRKWTFEQDGVRKVLAFPCAVSFNLPDALVRAAVRGAGIVQTTDMLVAEALASGRLQLVLGNWSTAGPPLSIVYPAVLRQSARVQVFAEFMSGLLLKFRRRVDASLALTAAIPPRPSQGRHPDRA